MEHNYMNEPKPTNRIIEMILGITGSVFGIIGGLIALILTNYDKSYGSELVGLMTIVATSSIILSAITLTLSCLINKRRVLMALNPLNGNLIKTLCSRLLILCILQGISSLVFVEFDYYYSF